MGPTMPAVSVIALAMQNIDDTAISSSNTCLLL
jgi:hypothetical protein